MERNQKNKATGALYIFCAFMLVIVMCIGIVTAMSANKTDKKKTPDLINEETTQKDTTTKKKTETKDTEDAMKESESDDTSSETTETTAADSTSGDKPSAVTPDSYYMPVTGEITKKYSALVPVFSMTMNDYRTHNGVDISAAVGTAVASFANGTVSNKYRDPFMGECIEITHNNGLVSKYMNLENNFPEGIEVGATVAGGQTIGCVGESAKIEAADSTHLHFEVCCDGKSVDPFDYIDFEAISQDSYEG